MGSKSPARYRAHRSTPTRSFPGDLVSKYGVQASATDLEALPLGPNPPPGDSALGYAIRYSPPRSESKRTLERPSSSDTGHTDLSATKGSVQQSQVNRPVHSEHTPVIQGPGQTRCNRPHRVHWSHRVHRSHRVHQSLVTSVPVTPIRANGHTGCTGHTW